MQTKCTCLMNVYCRVQGKAAGAVSDASVSDDILDRPLVSVECLGEVEDEEEPCFWRRGFGERVAGKTEPWRNVQGTRDQDVAPQVCAHPYFAYPCFYLPAAFGADLDS